ncbi:MAG TPA: ribbon-helix-helix protein, CopG family [Gemmatimonadota bacterium]|nr:ribbon-helix-helix protein, CopG family [Gemmatimonadota bacterium]
MVVRMKTTLNIDDTVMRRLRREAARQGRTMSELMEAALRLFLESRRAEPPGELPELPSFDSGGERVDVADREALYGAMDED